MIYTEDHRIKLGGVLLPGIIKKFEVKSESAVEEVEIEGSPIKPKQAVGYEDAKINIELLVDDTSGEKAIRKIERIKGLYKRGDQSKPQPLSIVSQETSAAGVSKVLFKSFSYTLNNKTDQYGVTIELWEYIPITMTAVSGGGTPKSSGIPKSSGGSPQLQENYQAYLNNNRGTAPKQKRKTDWSPATDGSPHGMDHINYHD